MKVTVDANLCEKINYTLFFFSQKQTYTSEHQLF